MSAAAPLTVDGRLPGPKRITASFTLLVYLFLAQEAKDTPMTRSVKHTVYQSAHFNNKDSVNGSKNGFKIGTLSKTTFFVKTGSKEGFKRRS